MEAAALAGGFADPVFDQQAVFRAVLDAFARPGSVVAVPSVVTPPAPLSTAAAAILGALADEATPVYLGPGLAASAVGDWIRFHTGAPLADAPEEAVFALLDCTADNPALAAFRQGTAAYPDRSATIIVMVDGLDGTAPIVLAGPGIDGEATVAPRPDLPELTAHLAAPPVPFPCGVDIVLAAPGAIVALPRSVRPGHAPATRSA